MPTTPLTKEREDQLNRRSLISRILRRVFFTRRKIPTASVKELLVPSPAPHIAAEPKPKPQRQRRKHPATPPRRPIENGSRPLMRIAIVNHKGGVGKTSTAINLSAALAEMDYKVLVFDCDSQGDLSAVYVPRSDQLSQSIANLFDGTAFVDDLIRETEYPNISVVTADERLNVVDKTHGFVADANVTCLADAVAAVQDRFDFILFDCPPRPHLSAFAALCAASHVVIPCEPSQFSVRSMVRLMEEIELARRTFNPKLQLLGFFLSKIANRSPSQAAYRKMLIDAFGEKMVMKTAIPVMATMEAAINIRKPVVYYRPRATASSIVRQLTSEIVHAHHGNQHQPAA